MNWRTTLQNFNLSGLMASSIYVTLAAVAVNEYVVYKFASAGNLMKPYQEVYRQTLVPRRKPDFIKAWEEKYGKN
jgi:hypothetical protein